MSFPLEKKNSAKKKFLAVICLPLPQVSDNLFVILIAPQVEGQVLVMIPGHAPKSRHLNCLEQQSQLHLMLLLEAPY